ncbi:uncharacterized protein K452DRAFT_302015 [Aplosporella prunicola CBS 121167]|uniref:Uncharacterized protein n=1 Tax=Aplosporella prunicola CBS 121167 TaxID=1176127 RepID=A0A6A6B096_9PEZI|nr:uncharacterized protein K452DRAFT_302015 [Aplosporella prunicola CBS 121167]KAF2137440.1 hypothetical protein K452DRAFT_302015 [Aplosporella prunicola CBS 121167]
MQYATAILSLFAATGLASAHHRPKQMPWDNTPSMFSIDKTDICWLICASQPLDCPEGWYSSQQGECYTCCRGAGDSKVGNVICKDLEDS